MNLVFVMTNGKALYDAKEDIICLFSVAKEAALTEQWIIPCFPFPSPSKDNLLHLTCDTWHVTPDMRHMTPDTWRMTHDTPSLALLANDNYDDDDEWN